MGTERSTAVKRTGRVRTAERFEESLGLAGRSKSVATSIAIEIVSEA
jgi:hypothetical protein